MSILDDAIREHLELKRAHGADEAELKKLEDEAFGPPARPDDPLAEAPTEFLAAPGMDAEQAAAEAQEAGGRRAPNITDLQEAPEAPAPTEAADAPAEEPSPSMEHQTIPVPHPENDEDRAEDAAAAAAADEPSIDSGPSTEERHAIADQPTEFFDVEADLVADADAGAEKSSPTDEQLLDSQLAEPRLAPVDPTGGIEVTGPSAPDSLADEDEDDDFFSEQRLSDELNNALEAPADDEHEVFAPKGPGAPPTDEHAALFTDEHEVVNTDEHEALDTGEHETEPPSGELELEPLSDEHEHDSGPFTEERDALSTDEHAFPATEEHSAFPESDEHPTQPPAEEPTAIYNVEDHASVADEDEDDDFEDEDPKPAKPSSEHEDVLEDTPDFLEDAPEDDSLWFEQQPPKDFDFDD